MGKRTKRTPDNPGPSAKSKPGPKPGAPNAGKPFAEIDKETFEKLCSFQCTMVEIASWFNVGDEAIDNFCVRTYAKPFKDVFPMHSGKGLISLRRRQFQKAMEGDTAMLKHLGEVYLRQHKKFEVESTVTTMTYDQKQMQSMTDEELQKIYLDRLHASH
jgi:hypothetical protein